MEQQIHSVLLFTARAAHTGSWHSLFEARKEISIIIIQEVGNIYCMWKR